MPGNNIHLPQKILQEKDMGGATRCVTQRSDQIGSSLRNHIHIMERPASQGCREESLILDSNARKVRAFITFSAWSPQGFRGCIHRGNIKVSTGGCVAIVVILVKRSPYIRHPPISPPACKPSRVPNPADGFPKNLTHFFIVHECMDGCKAARQE
ncbi:hypothetical protein BS47DRAFT_1348785 [Hydnum rufescens UP504]|uniref:Uncharacterized protein n=1 Tax=Hydnum rufescens UP504 TaxID=1448309 RepID=A0A9P6AQE1_9AGAM|nr:hypothetical protein BS47DRAFT_1348785 [Hydnum rufescens UP504]